MKPVREISIVRFGRWVCLPVAICFSFSVSAEEAAVPAAPAVEVGAEDGPVPGSVTHRMWRRSRLGSLKITGDSTAAEALILELDIPITYDYVATLMRTPNAFGEGPACIVCHSSNDPHKSYRGLDLSSCEGILRGATEKPAEPVIIPGKPLESNLIKRLRDNRMPLGVPFLHPTDSESIKKVAAWINAGAKNDENFEKNIGPLFHDEKAFGSDVACISCHSSHRDPPSFNEVNLSDYEAIMKGAFSRTNKKKGLPAKPIVIPFNAKESPNAVQLTPNPLKSW